MSDSFQYENRTNRIDIKPSVDPGDVFLWVHEGRNEAAMHIPKTAAPTLAAELLKAAGREDLASLIEKDAEMKALAERRDALATRLGADREYSSFSPTAPFRRAIDRIIELEDERDAA